LRDARDDRQCNSIVDMAEQNSARLLGHSAWNAATLLFGVGLDLLILPFVVFRLGVARRVCRRRR
jgi:hypothetical protein